MGEINVPHDVQQALKAIDSSALSSVINQCLNNESLYALQIFRLDSCGPFVASKRLYFEKAIREYRQSKAPKKRSDTRMRALRAGSDLLSAVQQMQVRVETEQKQAELFYIDDHIQPPFSFAEQLTVSVYYRWRPSIDKEWVHDSIIFFYKFDPASDYQRWQPARKISASQQARNWQKKLYDEWDRLRQQALWSVRDYFQNGGNGATIPKVFQVKVDAYTRGLNNFSARFWSEKS